MKKRIFSLAVVAVILITVIMSALVSGMEVVAADKEETAVYPELEEFSDLKGKRVSMLTGAPFEEMIRSIEPDVGEISFMNTLPDLVQAIKTNKIDAFLMNNAIAALLVNKNPELAIFPQKLQESDFGLAFAKNGTLRDTWQAAYDSIPKEQIEATWDKWTGADDSVKILMKQDWPGKNGTVKVAVVDTLEPVCYVGENGEIKGFDPEIILMIAKELDVTVEFHGMTLDAALSSVQSGKDDIGAGSIIVTAERAEAVDFVKYYPAAFVLIVRAVKEASDGTSFWDNIKASFRKTFITEKRWKLFAQGVLNTLIITVCSIIFGTALGFGIFMLCRKGNKAANSITNAWMKLVQGMPMVVLLMILYYLIFGKVAISGIVVAIIGFTITFSSAMIGTIRLGVGAVDEGQYDAAYALGYSDLQAFFKIILPQAFPHMLPVFKGEVVSLLKATAIVGYIAVQDLTKISDIVRSRTYEAFFPLIAVTIIYFALEGLLAFFIGRIENVIDFTKKDRKTILKGVKTDD